MIEIFSAIGPNDIVVLAVLLMLAVVFIAFGRPLAVRLGLIRGSSSRWGGARNTKKRLNIHKQITNDGERE